MDISSDHCQTDAIGGEISCDEARQNAERCAAFFAPK